MKPLQLAISAIALVPICCGALDRFSITETSETTIPRGNLVDMLAGDLGFPGLANFDVTASEELQNQGVSKEQIDSVKLTDLTLRVKAPAGGDLSFLNSLEFYVEAPGQSKVRIASGNSFPANQSQVSLDLDDVDLAPYAAAESMTITSVVDGRRPGQDTTVEASLELLIDVNVSGVICGS